MPIRTFDTVEEQRAGLESVAKNIEGFWNNIAKMGVCGDMTDAAKSDAGTLRLIASKLGA
jgi:hypothetical protein